MSSYYLRLALASFRRNPGLTALMVGAIALGIATCVMTLTVYHAMSGNPIWWKSDRLYAVTMDNWDVNDVYDPRRPALAPTMLTYKDSRYLADSKIPERKVVMYKVSGFVTGGTAERAPSPGDLTGNDRRLLRDVRCAIRVRQWLARGRRRGSGTGDCHQSRGKPAAVRRRQQRRPPHPVEQPTVPHHRDPERMVATAEIL